MKQSINRFVRLALALSLSMVPVYADELDDNMPIIETTRMTQSVPEDQQEDKASLTGEENHRKVKHEAVKVEREAMKAKWDSLSTAQKQEVYQIQDQINALKARKIDKLAQLGVIDRRTQLQIKERMKERTKAMKEAGKLPMGKIGCSKGADYKTSDHH